MDLSAQPRIPPAADLARALEEAGAIAEGVGQSVSTTHVVLALFTVPNPASVLLKDRGVDEGILLELLPRGANEPRAAVRRVLRSAEETALRCDARQINTLHLLVALLKGKETIAYRLLEGALERPGPFRNQVMSYLTGVLPRRLLDPIQDAKAGKPRPTIPRQNRPRFHRPGDDWVVPKETLIDAGPLPALPSQDLGLRRAPLVDADRDADDDDGYDSELDDAASFLSETPEYESFVEDDEDEDLRSSVRPITRAPTLLPTAYDLDPEKFPWLTALGRNLSSLAEHGLLDPAIGRSGEISQLIDVLGKRRANNPCLVGDPGVGKTAIAEGLAVKLVDGDPDVSPLRGKVIIELDMGRITAGTSLRGSFSERMQGLKKDVERARGRVIIFIDEIHTLMGAGSSGDAPQDAANELKAALARGAFPCIGSTTIDEYRKFIEADAALERRFVKVRIDEPDTTAAMDILRGVAPLYEAHHNVKVTDDGLSAAVQLSSRFVHDRKLPGKAIDLLDLAMSRARRAGQEEVAREQVARVCADVAKVPLERVLLEDARRFLEMELSLADRVVGHKHVIEKVAETIRRNYAGFTTHRPLGSFLFLGPSGVGKTELAKALAEFLYGVEDALITVDMSEYSEAHTVARLVGAPPGYVGHDRGGQLTEALRQRPHAVVLLDEVEKAHGDVLPLLLQILDEGRLTDARGREVTFRHAVIVMTSNLGSDAFQKQRARVGFGAPAASDDDDRGGRVIEAARQHLPPELWGRIEESLVFSPLSRPEMLRVAELALRASLAALKGTRGIETAWSDALLEHLVDSGGCDDATGARPLRQSVKRVVETPLAEAILSHKVKDGDKVRLDVKKGEVKVVRARR